MTLLSLSSTDLESCHSWWMFLTALMKTRYTIKAMLGETTPILVSVSSATTLLHRKGEQSHNCIADSDKVHILRKFSWSASPLLPSTTTCSLEDPQHTWCTLAVDDKKKLQTGESKLRVIRHGTHWPMVGHPLIRYTRHRPGNEYSSPRHERSRRIIVRAKNLSGTSTNQ